MHKCLVQMASRFIQQFKEPDSASRIFQHQTPYELYRNCIYSDYNFYNHILFQKGEELYDHILLI